MKRAPRIIPTGALRPVATGACHNCGNAITGHFCANCGQGNKLHVASAREFLHEFIGHHVAFEGKMWRTLKLLLLFPGKLTNEYIGGRRARYIPPLRLFLTLSFLFFLVIKFGTPSLTEIGNGKGTGNALTMSFDANDAKRAIIKLSKHQGMPEDIRKDLQAQADKIEPEKGKRSASLVHLDEDGESALDAAAKAEANGAGKNAAGTLNSYFHLAAKARDFSELPGDEQIKAGSEAFFAYAPYAIFCMMPVFALLLKVLYLGSGRNYGEHLLFALHANAFALVDIGLLVGLHHFSPPLEGGIVAVLVFWLIVYLPIAMLRTYGGRRRYAILRWITLMGFYIFFLMLAIMASLLIGVIV